MQRGYTTTHYTLPLPEAPPPPLHNWAYHPPTDTQHSSVYWWYLNQQNNLPSLAQQQAPSEEYLLSSYYARGRRPAKSFEFTNGGKRMIHNFLSCLVALHVLAGTLTQGAQDFQEKGETMTFGAFGEQHQQYALVKLLLALFT